MAVPFGVTGSNGFASLSYRSTISTLESRLSGLLRDLTDSGSLFVSLGLLGPPSIAVNGGSGKSSSSVSRLCVYSVSYASFS